MSKGYHVCKHVLHKTKNKKRNTLNTMRDVYAMCARRERAVSAP